MSLIPRVLLVMLLFTLPGLAQDPSTSCILNGPAYQLASDTVEWSMTLASGQSCVRGLRSAFVTLDDIELTTPPKAGQVVLQGPGFVYKGNLNFRGVDTFAFSVAGKLNKISGTSTIRVNVSIR